MSLPCLGRVPQGHQRDAAARGSWHCPRAWARSGAEDMLGARLRTPALRGRGRKAGVGRAGLRCVRVGVRMGTFGKMTLRSSFFFLVCILIENAALSKMPFRGDAVIGKCTSPVAHIVAFSSRTTSA